MMTGYVTHLVTSFLSVILTRMYSSRMRTIRCSGRPRRGLPRWGVCLLGGCLPVGGGWLSTRGLSACQTPPPCTEFFTHACENVTFPKLLYFLTIDHLLNIYLLVQFDTGDHSSLHWQIEVPPPL